MSLFGAMSAGVSGLQAQSSAMGAISDNVTNVNTTGYKGTNVHFNTLVTAQVSQTQYSPGGVQSAPRKGVDQQGLLKSTSSATDMAVSGQGLFITNEAAEPGQGDRYTYTRAGSFSVDEDGFLKNSGGFYLQGHPLQNWDGTETASTVEVGDDTFMKAYTRGNGDTFYINDNAVDSQNLRPLNLETIGGTAEATTTMSMGANLPAGDDIGQTHKLNTQIFDSLGNSHNLNYTWFKSGDNEWTTDLVPPAQASSLQMRDQDDQPFASNGRLDFRSIPADGASLDMTANKGYSINYQSGATPDSLVQLASQTNQIQFPAGGYVPDDGTTVTVKYGNSNESYKFEFDDDNTANNGGDVLVDISGAANADDAANQLAQSIQSKFENEMGNANWAQTDSIGGVTGVNLGAGLEQSDYTWALDDNLESTANWTTIGGDWNFDTTNGVASHNAGAGGTDDLVRNFSNLDTGSDHQVTVKVENVTQGSLDITFPSDGPSNTKTITSSGTYTLDVPAGDIDNTSEDLTLSASNDFDGAISNVRLDAADYGGNRLTFGSVGADNTNVTIDTSNKSLSQVIDGTAEAVNSVVSLMNADDGEAPPSGVQGWAERVSGTNGVVFRNASQNTDISVDVGNLTDSNNEPAVHQSDNFTVSDLGGNNWLNTATIKFNGDGTPDAFFGQDQTQASNPRGSLAIEWANGAQDMSGAADESPTISQFMGNYNKADGFTQLSGEYQINYVSQNGANFGNFTGVSIDEQGIVTALFDNGVTRPVFQIPLATFGNPNGLESLSGNAFIETTRSGEPTVREATSGGAGSVQGSSLEKSTVDIGEEFTDMITVQRAYSASSRIISKSDDMLETLLRTVR